MAHSVMVEEKLVLIGGWGREGPLLPMVTIGFLKSSSFQPMARRLAREVVIFSTLPGSPGSFRGSPVSW